jgi:prolyl oligopeptidase
MNNSLKFLFLIFIATSSIQTTKLTAQSKTTTSMKYNYPTSRIDNVIDDYHGTKVADPYRWLEDDNSAETKNWVTAQNALTFDYLNKIPFRNALRQRLEEL